MLRYAYEEMEDAMRPTHLSATCVVRTSTMMPTLALVSAVGQRPGGRTRAVG